LRVQLMTMSSLPRNMFAAPDALNSKFKKRARAEHGDLILTGAPPGIGTMKVGDTVEVIIQGIGTLRHTVMAGD
jgi:2-keto-4-pentenoate hydratase/2-oxohepta-3-ene-1,7-dioic acid hydratase in catechol pathway